MCSGACDLTFHKLLFKISVYKIRVWEFLDINKCRYMAFQPTLNEENNPYIKQFLEKELCAGLSLQN